MFPKTSNHLTVHQFVDLNNPLKLKNREVVEILRVMPRIWKHFLKNNQNQESSRFQKQTEIPASIFKQIRKRIIEKGRTMNFISSTFYSVASHSGGHMNTQIYHNMVILISESTLNLQGPCANVSKDLQPFNGSSVCRFK